MGRITLSALPHTWLIDLDGTILKHNGYKNEGEDVFLPGAREFLQSIPDYDIIIFLTSRDEDIAEATESFLRANGIKFAKIIYSLPYGERILINDSKPSGLETAISINRSRDCSMDLTIEIDEFL